MLGASDRKLRDVSDRNSLDASDRNSLGPSDRDMMRAIVTHCMGVGIMGFALLVAELCRDWPSGRIKLCRCSFLVPRVKRAFRYWIDVGSLLERSAATL